MYFFAKDTHKPDLFWLESYCQAHFISLPVAKALFWPDSLLEVTLYIDSLSKKSHHQTGRVIQPQGAMLRVITEPEYQQFSPSFAQTRNNLLPLPAIKVMVLSSKH